MQLTLRNCVEPASEGKPTTKYCKSLQEVKSFFLANEETRVMYNENRVAISNSTHPLTT